MEDKPPEQFSLNDISQILTEDILKECLCKEYGTKVELESYKVQSLSAKGGDSYISATYKIEVHGLQHENQKRIISNYFVKCLPPNIARRKTFRSDEFFRNEVIFYTKVMSAFVSFQDKQKPKMPFTELPRCFYAVADGENDFIILEDLLLKNFEPMGRSSNLDYEKCKIILELLGRFHALSFAMKDKEPDEFRKISSLLQETYFKPELKSWYTDQLKMMTNIAIDAVSKELPECVYEEKLRYFTSTSCYERMIEFVKPKEPYSVINHGDAWAPNFLFTHALDDENTIQNLCTIDFQLARYASPILDIATFVYTCASRDVILNQFDDILLAYYKSLSNFLLDLGSSADVMFPYKQFQSEVKSHFAFGMGVSLESVPLSIVEGNDTPDVEAIEGDEAVPLTEVWALQPIRSKEGRIRLATNIKHAVDRGFV